MVLKIISATEAKPGTNIILDGEPYTVKKIDVSKTGKHGAAKCRIEASGIISNQKKIIAVPGHERFEVPMVDKRKAQVLSIGEKVSVMDLENFENFEMDCDEEIRSGLGDNSTVEYWDIEGRKIIKRQL
ncbi:translation initiation factor IF-5A [Candidatus Pacearchaeota archaeon RBG_16_35_8]|nr:MAG: translation initiation factor IF-5A [Candidatus Pacearchaeota archaeon RBG_16_35_8]